MNTHNQHQRKVRDIFMQVSEASEPERSELLNQLCGDDVSLRQEVESLLNADQRASAALFMTDPTSADTAVLGAFAVPNEPIGSHIGPYKLLELIGEGGFGAVYVAEQDKPVRRRVALKVIKLGMDTRQVIARFEAERQALAMMDHPNIARVLDAGATESGRPWFAMELVRGVPITEYCDAANLPAAERLELFTQVCHAVQHAHQKGVIHRDIKPSNVLVTLHDGKPVPKVIDFGIAKAVGAQLTDKTVYTLHRQMIGTPAYMSPEQAEMSGLDVDTRADVYSLGVLLYELLTGSPPFAADDLIKAGLLEMQRIIREVEPVKPSTRVNTLGETLPTVAAKRRVEPKKLGLLLRGDLDWIAMKCLEKDRQRRYETANALAEDVKRHLGGEPVVAAPPSAAYRLRKFVKKHRTSVMTAALVGIVLVAGITGTTWGMWRAERKQEQLNALNQKLKIQNEGARTALEKAWEILGGSPTDLIKGIERNAEFLNEKYGDSFITIDDLQIAKLGNLLLGLADQNKAIGSDLFAANKELEAANAKLQGENKRAMVILTRMALICYPQWTVDINAAGIYSTPKLTDGSFLWICRPTWNDPDNIAILDPSLYPGRTMDEVIRNFPVVANDPIPADKAVLHISKLIEYEHDRMEREVKRAELAETDFIFEKWPGSENFSDPERAIIDLRNVVATREKHLGHDALETVKALWKLSDAMEQAHGVSDSTYPYETLREDAIQRVERAGGFPDGGPLWKDFSPNSQSGMRDDQLSQLIAIKIRLSNERQPSWESLGSEFFLALDLAREGSFEEAERRIDHVAGLVPVAAEGRDWKRGGGWNEFGGPLGYLTDGFTKSFEPKNPEDFGVELAELVTDFKKNLMLWAAQSAFHLEQYEKTIAALSKSCDLGKVLSPCGLAILAISHHQLGHISEARAAFAKLKDLMTKPDFANDADCQALFKEAQELVEGSATTQPTQK